MYKVLLEKQVQAAIVKFVRKIMNIKSNVPIVPNLEAVYTLTLQSEYCRRKFENILICALYDYDDQVNPMLIF